MVYMVTFTINIPPMLAYIPYMDPMGNRAKWAFTAMWNNRVEIPFFEISLIWPGGKFSRQTEAFAPWDAVSWRSNSESVVENPPETSTGNPPDIQHFHVFQDHFLGENHGIPWNSMDLNKDLTKNIQKSCPWYAFWKIRMPKIYQKSLFQVYKVHPRFQVGL